jgi:hypothetical protein
VQDAYAEAVKKVEEDGVKGDGVVLLVDLYQYRGKDQYVIYASVRYYFLAFIAMVINCTGGMERKSQKSEVVVSTGREVFGCARLDVRRVVC